MAIQMMQMESKGMQTAISFVKKMTKSMTVDENMDQANWPKARRRNNLIYKKTTNQANLLDNDSLISYNTLR